MSKYRPWFLFILKAVNLTTLTMEGWNNFSHCKLASYGRTEMYQSIVILTPHIYDHHLSEGTILRKINLCSSVSSHSTKSVIIHSDMVLEQYPRNFSLLIKKWKKNSFKQWRGEFNSLMITYSYAWWNLHPY